MRSFQPRSKLQNERLITRLQGGLPGAPSFVDGIWYDATNPPSSALKYSENYHIFADRIEPRGGSKQWSAALLPSLRGRSTNEDSTAYSITKSGTTVTKTVGTNFAAADVGRYIVWDDGAHERIVAVLSTTEVTVEDSTAHAASTAGWVRDPVNLLAFHEGRKKLVLQMGTKLYVLDPRKGSFTASRASTTVTATTPIFAAGDVGHTITFGDGTTAKI